MIVLLLLPGAFTELRKASINLDMSFRLAAWNNSASSGRIYEILYLSIFRYTVEKPSGFIKIGQELRVLYLQPTRYFFMVSLSVLLGMRNVADNNCSGNQITHFVFNYFFFENYAVYEIMWKNVVERGTPHDNMAHSHCMLDNSGYKPTLGMCNTY
jgi:hypothetical protein